MARAFNERPRDGIRFLQLRKKPASKRLSEQLQILDVSQNRQMQLEQNLLRGDWVGFPREDDASPSKLSTWRRLLRSSRRTAYVLSYPYNPDQWDWLYCSHVASKFVAVPGSEWSEVAAGSGGGGGAAPRNSQTPVRLDTVWIYVCTNMYTGDCLAQS